VTGSSRTARARRRAHRRSPARTRRWLPSRKSRGAALQEVMRRHLVNITGQAAPTCTTPARHTATGHQGSGSRVHRADFTLADGRRYQVLAYRSRPWKPWTLATVRQD